MQDGENLRQRFALADAHLRELINVRADGNRDLINVRAGYDKLLRIATEKQAEALAGQLATIQETSRTEMSTRFAAVDTQLGELRVQLTSLVSSLAAGQAQVVEQRAATGETRLNLGAIFGFVFGSLGLLTSLIMIAVVLTR